MCDNKNIMITPKEIIKTRRRSIALIINSKGELIVRAPYYVNKTAVLEFVAHKQDWIHKQLQLVEQEKECCQPLSLAEKEKISILGQTYYLTLQEVPQITVQGENLLLPFNVKNKDVEEYLKSRLLPLVTRLVQIFARVMEVTPLAVSLSGAKTKWGSCSYTNRLKFSWHLCFCPLEVITYVVVHELSHIKYKSHNKQFWQQVEEVLPSYREQEDWLKAHRRIMDIL